MTTIEEEASPVSEQTDFIREAMSRMRVATEYDRHNRQAFQEDMRFMNGEQWDTGIKQDRDLDGRPSLVLNQLPQFVDQIMGDIRLNRPRIKVRPSTSAASVAIAKIFDGIIRNIEYYSTAESVYDSAAESMVTGGYGAWRIITKYEGDDSFNQKICIEWIPNPLSVYFDPRPYDLSKEDANWCFVTEWVTRDEFKRRYPKKQPVSIPESGTGDSSGWFEKDKVKISEYWIREAIEKKIVQLSDGRVMTSEKATEAIEQAKLQENLAALESGQPIQSQVPTIVKDRMVSSHTVKRYVIYGLGELEGPEVFPGTIIPIIPVYGKMVVVDGKRFIRGMVRMAKDAQRMYNYWRSAETEFVALQPKSPWIGTAKQVEGHETQWKLANKRNIAYLKYNGDPAAQGPPQRQQPPAASPGMFQGSTQALEDIRGTMGLHEASLGMNGNERTGKAIEAKERTGDVGNFAYVDNLCKAMRLTGRILVDIIPEIHDTAQELMIRQHTGEETPVMINQPGEERGQMINDLSAGKYEAMVDTGPSYTTARQEAAAGMLGFASVFPEAAPLIQDLVAKSQDWEFAQEISERLKRTIPPAILLGSENIPQQPPSSDERMSESKAQQAEAKVQRELLKVDEEKIQVMRAALELQKDKAGNDVKKMVLDVLSDLLKGSEGAKQNTDT